MSGQPVLVGRTHERAVLRSAIERAAAGQPSLVLLHGEAGIGKTSLVREAAAAAEADGAHVLPGHCLRFGGPVASYLPFTQALTHWLRTSTTPLRNQLAPHSRLEELVPALHDDSAGLALLQIGTVVDELQADRPTVLVVDDLQWSDASSLDVLSYLVAGFGSHQRLSILVTYRDTDLEDGHRLHGWLADAIRMPAVEKLELGRLDLWDIDQMVLSRRPGRSTARLAREVLERSGGNPYLADLLIDAADPTGAIASPPTGRLVDAMSASWHRLSPPARRLTQLLAVAGAPTAMPVLREMAIHHGVTSEESSSALDEAAAQGVTVQTESGAVWFRHPLFAEVVALTVPTGDLAELHGFLASTWEAAHDVDERDRATSLTLHYVAAGDDAAGFAWALRAADEAEAIAGWEEVATHLSTAVSLLERLPEVAPAVDQVALLQRAGRACSVAGDERGAVDHHEAALAKVDRSRDPLLASRILLELHYLRNRAGVSSTANVSVAEPWEVLHLLAGLPESPERAQALAQLSFGETFDGRTKDAREHAEEAVSLAEASGDDAALIWALGARGQSQWGTDEGVADSASAFARAKDHGDPQLLRWASVFLSNSYASSGRYAEAVQVLDESYVTLRDSGNVDSAAILGAIGALNSFELGRWNLVRRQVRELLTLARSDNSSGAARCVAALLTAHEGHTEAARLHLRRAGELMSAAVPVGNPLVDTQIQVDMATGDPLTALELIQTHMAEALEVSPTSADAWLELASRAALQLADRPTHDVDRQSGLHRLKDIEELRGTEPPPFVPSGSHDVVHPARGALHAAQRAHCLRVGDEEVELWEAACRATKAAEMSFEHARALVCLARLLLTRRLDRGRAVVALTAARGIADELGAVPLVHDIDVLAAQAHLSLAETGAVQGTRLTPALRAQPPFTRRESEVVEGLLSGETYAQIASRLFISEKTVSTHVSNILRKTGTTSRIQLADLARRSPVSSPQDD